MIKVAKRIYQFFLFHFSATYKSEVLDKLRKTKILSYPRYTLGKAVLKGTEVTFVDSWSYLFQEKEIFEYEIYKFKTTTECPVIFDVGSNIGLSVLYFKYLFPKSQITCFEPDPIIFEVLQNNLKSAGILDVLVYNSAVSSTEGEVYFASDFSDSGKVVASNTNLKVPSKCLSNFIVAKIDFLKIDIEGAEVEVILEISEKLHLVDKIFIEYHSFITGTQKLDLILSTLTSHGFRYHLFSQGDNTVKPFTGSDNGKMDFVIAIAAERK